MPPPPAPPASPGASRLRPRLLPEPIGAVLGRWIPDRPGAAQRLRTAVAALLAGMALLLRPWPPFRWLPGWFVGGLLLWAVVEVLLWQWRPRRWR